MVEETYNKAVSGARADVTAVRHGALDTDGAAEQPMRSELVTGEGAEQLPGDNMRCVALRRPTLDLDGEEMGPQGRGSVINAFPLLTAATTNPKSPAAAVERLDLSFTCLQLHPAGTCAGTVCAHCDQTLRRKRVASGPCGRR